MLNTTQLECFLAVANHLNFSRAAQELHITQPAVSHQINTLEAELEVKLFHRTSKNVRLTQAGHQFGQYAREILKLTGISRARMRQWREELPQRMGLGCRNFLVLRALQPALTVLRQETPQLLPVLRQVPSASLDNLLEEEDVQAIFTMQREAGPKTSRRHLADCPVACVCAPDHPLAGYEQLTVDQLNAAGGRIASCPPPFIRRLFWRCSAMRWPGAGRTAFFSVTVWKSPARWWNRATPSPCCRTCRAPACRA